MATFEKEQERRVRANELLKKLKRRLVAYAEQMSKECTVLNDKVYFSQNNRERARKELISDLNDIFENGTKEMWNTAQEDTEDYFKKHTTSTINASWQPIAKYNDTSDAYKAFYERKEKGMNISERIWKLTAQYQKEIEDVIDTAVRKGTSAGALAERVKKYTNNYSLYYNDSKEVGKAPNKIQKNIKSNALRLARTEINMAYRKSENNRYNSEWFVVGYEIHTSGTHKADPNDICERCAGKYPKNFVWSGWHPNCKCYMTPILCDRDELNSYDGTEGSIPTSSKNSITKLPRCFTSYMQSKGKQVRQSKPYFYRDNKKLIDENE